MPPYTLKIPQEGAHLKREKNEEEANNVIIFIIKKKAATVKLCGRRSDML